MDVSYPAVFVIQVIGCHILLNCVLPLFLISVSFMDCRSGKVDEEVGLMRWIIVSLWKMIHAVNEKGCL